MNNIELKAKVLAEIHPFTLKEQKELQQKILDYVKPYLIKLEAWRRLPLSNYRL